MSKIDEMIAGLCPDGVEYKRLEEISSKANNIRWKDKLGESKFYVDLSSVDVLTHRIGELVEVDESSAPSRAKQIIQSGDLIFATTRPTQMRCCVVPDELDGQLCSTGYCVLRINRGVDNRFVFHALTSDSFKMYLQENQSEGNYPAISDRCLRRYEIPVPPVEIQREVVRILDSFAELEAELEARKAQYAYYRDRLLSPSVLDDLNGTLITSTLGELMTIQRGASPRPIKQFITKDPNGIPWIKIGDVSSNGKFIEHTQERITHEGASKSRLLHTGAFVLSNSMSWGRPYILKTDGCIHDGWLSLTGFEHVYLPDFLFHLLKSTTVQRYWSMKVNTGSVSNLNADLVKATPVPVPSLETQQKVVDILDRFDALTTSLTDGLPAEIEARRQQYEYYRDKLLSFPRKESAA